ncbi:MAG TPA: ABC transporter permease [Acidimicrobiales bacterium]|nr:ABC transporter permease [Acidimicrobiales bacterium]
MTARAVRAQATAELRLTLRRGDSVLLTLAIPVGLLVFFSVVTVLPLPSGVHHAVQFLAPGIIALAVMSTAMVSLGIATGFERQYGVLKRLGATPLGRPALLTAKTAAILAVEVVQLAVLVAVAFALGWAPGRDPGLAVPAVVLATAGFAGLGLLMAGSLRAEVTLAAANGLYLILLLTGGMVFPLTSLPGPLADVARALPSAALSSALHGALGGGPPAGAEPWIVLAAWAVVAPLVAARLFRWE